MTTPYLLCDAGYFCKSGAKTATPQQDSLANVCPAGHYCVEGTAAPTKCPVGTYSNNTKLKNETDCRVCTAGEIQYNSKLICNLLKIFIIRII